MRDELNDVTTRREKMCGTLQTDAVERSVKAWWNEEKNVHKYSMQETHTHICPFAHTKIPNTISIRTKRWMLKLVDGESFETLSARCFPFNPRFKWQFKMLAKIHFINTQNALRQSHFYSVSICWRCCCHLFYFLLCKMQSNISILQWDFCRIVGDSSTFQCAQEIVI